MSGQGFAVIASGDADYDIPSAARVVARARRTVLFEASRFLRDHPGMFARGIDRAEADRLATALTHAGIPSTAVTEDALAAVPEAVSVDQGRFSEGVFHCRCRVSARSRQTQYPLDRVALVACGWVAGSKTERRLTLDQDVRSTRYGGARAGGLKSEKVEKTTWRQLLDVVGRDPELPHLRIDSMEFKYRSLGVRLFSTRAANFMALAGLFSVHCPGAYIDRGIDYLLDDDPRTAAKFVSMEAYDNFLIWKATLAKLASKG